MNAYEEVARIARQHDHRLAAYFSGKYWPTPRRLTGRRLTFVFGSLVLYVTLVGGRTAAMMQEPPTPKSPRQIAARQQGHTDAAVYTLIEMLRDRADQIKVDGNDSDWEGVPAFVDQKDDSKGDASRDIVKTAVLPRENDLVVLIVTSGRPSQEHHAFGFDVDYMGAAMPGFGRDLKVYFGHPGGYGVNIHPEGTSAALPELEVAVGNVVEVRLPYTALARTLPAKKAELLNGPQARTWLRVFPFAWNASTRKVVDFGAAVASYRLLSTPFALDQPLPKPKPEPATRAIDLPFMGKWHMGQGPFCEVGTHKDYWAYDLSIFDHTLHASPSGSQRVEDYYAWNKPVLAPESGRVSRKREDVPDRLDGKAYNPKLRGQTNGVSLDIGGGFVLWLAHFRKGGVRVGIGAKVRAGRVLGSLGIGRYLPRRQHYSKTPPTPHLHMALYKGTARFPLALRNVRVSLNFADDDPWSRDLDIWKPREGFFVERSKRRAPPKPRR